VAEAIALRLRIESATSPTATTLFAGLNAEIAQRYPGGPASGMDATAFAAGGGVLAIGTVGNAPACCGGFRPLDGETVEIKRMYTAPMWRRRGLSRRLLAFIEAEAALRGFARAVLETGTRQPEAIALYASCGWQQIAPYGHYADDPLSVCFAKRLSAIAPPE
jgi:GNAT superfamily N-acetyltransferase